MLHCHLQSDAALGEGPLRIARALREALPRGYPVHNFRADVMAGVVVGIVGRSIWMALATSLEIAPGVPRLVTRRPAVHP